VADSVFIVRLSLLVGWGREEISPLTVRTTTGVGSVLFSPLSATF
jgi:hypothetical protein